MREQFPVKCGLKKNLNQNFKKSLVKNVNIVKHFQPKIIHKHGNNLQNLPEVNADIDIKQQLNSIKVALTTAKKNIVNKNKSQNLYKQQTKGKTIHFEPKKIIMHTTPHPKKFTQIISSLKSKSFQDDKLNSRSDSQNSTSTVNRFKSKSFTITSTTRDSSKSSNLSEKLDVPKTVNLLVNKRPNTIKSISYEKIEAMDSISTQKLKAGKSKSFPSTSKYRRKIEQTRNKKLLSSSDSEQTDNYLVNLKKEIKNNALITKQNINYKTVDSNIIKFRQRRIAELREELHMLMSMKVKHKRELVVDLKNEISTYKRTGGEIVYNVTSVKDEFNTLTDDPSCKYKDVEMDLDFSSVAKNNLNKNLQDSSTQSAEIISGRDSSMVTEKEDGNADQENKKEELKVAQCISCNTANSSCLKTDEAINKKIEKATILINRVKQTLNEIKSRKGLRAEDDQQTTLSTNESNPSNPLVSENEETILSNVKVFETNKIPYQEIDLLRPKTRRFEGFDDDIDAEIVERFKTEPTDVIAESDTTDFDILEEKLNTILERSETEDTSSLTDKPRENDQPIVETVSIECNTNSPYQMTKSTQLDSMPKEDVATQTVEDSTTLSQQDDLPKEATTQTTDISVNTETVQTEASPKTKLCATNIGVVTSEPSQRKLTAETVQSINIAPRKVSEYSQTNSLKIQLTAERAGSVDIPSILVCRNSQLKIQLLPSINIPRKLHIQKVFIYSLEASIETITYHPEAYNIGFFLDRHNSFETAETNETQSSLRSNFLSMNEDISSPTPTLLRVQSMINQMDLKSTSTGLINLANLVHDYQQYTSDSKSNTSLSNPNVKDKILSVASVSSLHNFLVTEPNNEDKDKEITRNSEIITVINFHESSENVPKSKKDRNTDKEENKNKRSRLKIPIFKDKHCTLKTKCINHDDNLSISPRRLSVTPNLSRNNQPISDKDLVLRSFHVYENKNVHDPGILEAHSFDMLHTSMDDNVYKTFINPEGLQVLTSKSSKKYLDGQSLKLNEKGHDEKEQKELQEKQQKELQEKQQKELQEKQQKELQEKQQKESQEKEQEKHKYQEEIKAHEQEKEKSEREKSKLETVDVSIFDSNITDDHETRKSVTYANLPRIYKIGLYNSQATQCSLDQKFKPANYDDYEKISFSISYSTEDILSPESTVSVEHILPQTQATRNPVRETTTIEEEVEQECWENPRSSKKSIIPSLSIPDSTPFRVLKEKIGKEHPMDVKNSFQLQRWVEESDINQNSGITEPVVPDFISGLISDAPDNLGKIIPVIRRNLKSKTDIKDNTPNSQSVDDIKKEKDKKNEHTIMHVQICGDCIPTNLEKDFKYINPLEIGDNGRYKDEEHLFCESNYPHYEDLFMTRQKFRYIPHFTVSRSSKQYYNWDSSTSETNTTISTTDKSLSEGEGDCNCSISYGEIHQCPDLNHISSLWKSTLLRNDQHVKIHKRKANFNNIMTYYINKNALLNDSTSSSTVK